MVITWFEGTELTQLAGTTTGDSQETGTFTVFGTVTNEFVGIWTKLELGTLSITIDGTYVGTFVDCTIAAPG